jgi:hypothetical protein
VLSSIVLSGLLIFPAPGEAQQSTDLRIIVVAGEAATHNLGKGVVTIPEVEVQTGQGTPVEGAEVTFTSPLTGPSATFYGATHAITMKADASGRAIATGFAPNAEEGSYSIEVVARYRDGQAAVPLPQTNVVDPLRGREKKKFPGWRLLTAIAVGVGIGITAAVLRGNESSRSTPSGSGSGPLP